MYKLKFFKLFLNLDFEGTYRDAILKTIVRSKPYIDPKIIVTSKTWVVSIFFKYSKLEYLEYPFGECIFT